MKLFQGTFSKIKNWFSGIWNKTEARDRTRFLVISGIALFLIIAAFVMLNNGRFQELVPPGGATPADMSAATTALSDGGIRFRTPGGAIHVHRDDFAEANALLVMSADTSIELGLSIYAEATGLTTTADERSTFYRFQREDHLKRILEAMPEIRTAQVIISEPEPGTFFEERRRASASVILFVDEPFSQEAILSLESFISNGTDAPPENITIIDQHGIQLNRSPDDGDIRGSLLSNLDYQFEVERHLSDAARRILHPMFGEENFQVVASAAIDFDRTTRENMEFTPVVGDEGIARSRRVLNETARGLNLPGGFPGTEENALGVDFADMYPEVFDAATSEYARLDETINYEINQFNTFIEEMPGTLENVTLSVVINSDIFRPDIDRLSSEELENLERIAENSAPLTEIGAGGFATFGGTEGYAGYNILGGLSGIGIDRITQGLMEANGAAVHTLVSAAVGLTGADAMQNVVVRFQPMFGNRAIAAERDAFDAERRRQELMRLIQTIVLYLIIGACVLLLILRTFSFLAPKPLPMPELLLAADDNLYDDLLDASDFNAELEVTKTPSRELIEEFIETNPSAVASLLRNWLQEGEDDRW